jgi:hypothetical protein
MIWQLFLLDDDDALLVVGNSKPSCRYRRCRMEFLYCSHTLQHCLLRSLR